MKLIADKKTNSNKEELWSLAGGGNYVVCEGGGGRERLSIKEEEGER